MNIKDIDTKIIAVVLRAYHETALKLALEEMTASLSGYPDTFIAKVVKYFEAISGDTASKFESVMADFELGKIDFDNVVLLLSKATINNSIKIAQDLQDIIYAYAPQFKNRAEQLKKLN